MHESVIAAELVRKVREVATAAGAKKVLSVTVRMGVYSGVVKEALEFAFEQLRGKGLLEECRLVVETAPSEFFCPQCRKTYYASQENFRCPDCGAMAQCKVGSQELTLSKIEICD